MKKHDLLNFAKGKSMAEKRVTCTLSRDENNEVQINRIHLNDLGEDFIIKICCSKQDSEFFKTHDFSERIEVCRQKLLKFDINTITLDEQDLDM
jgi:hypothetical protein